MLGVPQYLHAHYAGGIHYAAFTFALLVAVELYCSAIFELSCTFSLGCHDYSSPSLLLPGSLFPRLFLVFLRAVTACIFNGAPAMCAGVLSNVMPKE